MKFFLGIILFFTLFLGTVLTISFAKKEHREHDAHVHGGATLNIAFDQLKGRIEFKSAAESVLGFEHVAKKEKDIKILNEALGQFENQISKMIQFDESLKCIFVKTKIEVTNEVEKKHDHKSGKHKKHKGQHSDFVAKYDVNCEKSIKASKLIIDFSFFKNIKDLDVTILADDYQKSIEVNKKPITVELK